VRSKNISLVYRW